MIDKYQKEKLIQIIREEKLTIDSFLDQTQTSFDRQKVTKSNQEILIQLIITGYLLGKCENDIL